MAASFLKRKPKEPPQPARLPVPEVQADPKQGLSLALIQKIIPLGLSEEEVRRSYTAHAARHRSTTQYFTQQVRAAAGLILDHDPPGELAVQQAGDLVTSAAMIGGLSRLLAEKLLLLEGRTLENGGSIQIEQPGKRDL